MTGNRLWKKLLICFGLVVIPLMAILSFLFAHSNRLQRQNEQALNENLTLQTVSSVLSQISLAENMCKAILQNDMLTAFLDREYHTHPDLAYYQTTIRDFVKVTNGVSDIRLKLFLENETIPMGFGIFYPMRYLNSVPGLQGFYEGEGSDGLWLDGSYADAEGYLSVGSDTFCFFMRIRSGAKNLGIIMASIPKNTFVVQYPNDSKTVAPVYYRGYSIYNQTGSPLTDEALNSITSGGVFDNLLSTGYEFPDGPFHVMVVTRYNRSYIIAPTFIIICVACALLTGLYIMFTRRLLRDIYGCMDGIEEAVRKNFRDDAGEACINDVLASRKDEIADLARRILSLIDRIRLLLLQQVEEQTASKQAQLLALQHQINPHFLYNTMEVFSSRMELAGLYEDSAAISAFCRMLRYNINSKDLTTLADELEQVQNYLAIQKIRNRPFEISTDIPEGLLHKHTIRFLLEPFIENSFKYCGEASPLCIRIAARDRGSFFGISISNNGKALEQLRVEELNRRFLSAPASLQTSGDKIGLSNINSRLKLFYGDEYCIHVECSGGWICFSFEIPYSTE